VWTKRSDYFADFVLSLIFVSLLRDAGQVECSTQRQVEWQEIHSVMNFDEWLKHKFSQVRLTRNDLHHYQSVTAYEFLLAKPFCALFQDMGLGKTVTTATVVADLLALFAYEHVLIIAPLKVALETWPTELRQWMHLAPFNFSVIHARDDDPYVQGAVAQARIKARDIAREFELPTDEAQKFVQYQSQKAQTAAKHEIRTRAAHSRATIHIISRDWIPWLVNLHGKQWPYRCVIVDESSGFKDHKSDRFKALAKVRRLPGAITRLHELTAKPAAEGYEYLFAQMYLLDLGERLGKNITRYRERYFTYNRWTRKWKLRPGADEEILQKISDLCLVMSRKDHLKDLYDPVIVERKVVLDAEQMALYQQMQKEFLVTLRDGSVVEAETAVALSAKLLQMASGVLYDTQRLLDWDTGDLSKVRKVHHLHDHKLDELREIVDESQGEPLLVAYHFKSSIARLRKAFPQATLMDKDGRCIKSWNAKKLPILFVHPQSSGNGLNLQQGGHHLIFFDIPWSYDLFSQMIGRLDRQGQTFPVVVQLLLAAGTYDEHVRQALIEKENTEQHLLHRLKMIAAGKI
jgi:SNF2 family DNA or RNA helicase